MGHSLNSTGNEMRGVPHRQALHSCRCRFIAHTADLSARIRINLRTAGISRRGEGGWNVDGWALVVARRSPLPGLDIAVPQTGFPAPGRPQGPQPYPTPLPPLRETRRLTIFSFLFHLRLMRI